MYALGHRDNISNINKNHESWSQRCEKAEWKLNCINKLACFVIYSPVNQTNVKITMFWCHSAQWIHDVSHRPLKEHTRFWFWFWSLLQDHPCFFQPEYETGINIELLRFRRRSHMGWEYLFWSLETHLETVARFSIEEFQVRQLSAIKRRVCDAGLMNNIEYKEIISLSEVQQIALSLPKQSASPHLLSTFLQN